MVPQKQRAHTSVSRNKRVSNDYGAQSSSWLYWYRRRSTRWSKYSSLRCVEYDRLTHWYRYTYNTPIILIKPYRSLTWWATINHILARLMCAIYKYEQVSTYLSVCVFVFVDRHNSFHNIQPRHTIIADIVLNLGVCDLTKCSIFISIQYTEVLCLVVGLLRGAFECLYGVYF